MAIKYHPNRGDILICDFSGTIPPEINKRRPVIVLTPRLREKDRLLTVVPISTTAPKAPQRWHTKVALNLPHPYNSPIAWVKGDLLMTVSFERLFMFSNGKDESGKRLYQSFSLTDEEMERVWECVFYGLGRADVLKKFP